MENGFHGAFLINVSCEKLSFHDFLSFTIHMKRMQKEFIDYEIIHGSVSILARNRLSL